MTERTAHILEQKWRSDDIRIGEDVDFSSFLLPPKILKGLEQAGFKYPSPIQLKAIPVGKIGKDLIVQAKSGTGKTLVFTVIALNMLIEKTSHPQVLIMTPTREIAMQISEVIKGVGKLYKDLKCEYFIGGTPLEEDKSKIQGCQIIVGTPGRIRHLVGSKMLKTSGIRLFVLDEADELLKKFSSFTSDIDDIYRALPRDKQMIAASATYPNKLKALIKKYFRDPLLIRLNQNDIGLLGMVHYYQIIPVSRMPVIAYQQKLKVLGNVLRRVQFAQCLVFCNMVTRVENLCVVIKQWGFAATFISSAREQEGRLNAIELLKKFRCKVLVSSDITARGIDAENVDLVINFDVPGRLETYFHRVGRAGRYGSKCASVTFITSDEIESYQQMQVEGKFKSYALPDIVPEDLVSLQPKRKSSVKKELPLDDVSKTSSDSDSDGEDLNKIRIDKQPKGKSSVKKELPLDGVSKTSSYSSSDGEDLNEIITDKQPLKQPRRKSSVKKELPLDDTSKTSSDSDGEDLNEIRIDKQPLKQPKRKSSVKKELPLDNGNESSDSSFDGEDINKNGIVKQKKANGFSEDIELNGHNELSHASKFEEFASKNLENLSDEKLPDYEVISTESRDSHEMQNHLHNLNSNSTNSVKGVEDSSCSPESVKLEFDEIDSPTSLELKQPEVVAELPTSSEIISVQDENNLEVNKGSGEKSRSCLLNHENGLKNSLKEKIIDGKSLTKTNEIMSSCITFVDKYEHCNKGSEQFSAAGDVKPSQSINVESNDEKFSPTSLKHYRLGLSQYHYFVRKNFVVNFSEDLINKTDQGYGKESVNEVSEIKEQANLKKNNSEDKIQNCNLDSQFKLFSTPKAEALSGMKSGDSSELESSSGSDKDKLLEHFNLRLESIQKVKPSVKKTSTLGSSSSSESSSDTSVDSKDAMYELAKRFNKVSQERAGGCNKKAANIISYAKSSSSSSSSSSDSDTGTSMDTDKEFVKLDKKFTEMAKAKKSAGPTIDAEETKKLLREIQSTNKCFKGIHIADNAKHVDSSTSSTSDSDASIGCGKAKDEPKNKVNKRMQIVKTKVGDIGKSSESSNYKTKTLKGHAENKIRYSDSENDVGQYSLESPPGPQDGHVRKTCKNGRAKNVNEPVENKGAYYSGRSSSETDIDQHSKKSSSSFRVSRQRKSNKNDETPKAKPSRFNYSNATGTSYPNTTPASERPIYPLHSFYQMQPAYYAFDPSHPQQIHNHANDGQCFGTQSSYMQPPCVPNPPSQPYPSECSLKESCQLRSQPHGNGHTADYSIPSMNHVQSNYQMQASHYAYNQCFAPSQHPCHPPNGTCQSPACTAWYDTFYKQWHFINQSPYF